MELRLLVLFAGVGVQHHLREAEPVVSPRQSGRRRLHGSALLILFVGLITGTLGYDLLRRYAPSFFGERWGGDRPDRRLSRVALFLFLVSAYYRLTNARLSVRDVIPGAVIGAVLLELTLQALPLFVYVTGDVVTLQVLGTTFLLLVWLYLMANVIVFGAELNWWAAQRDGEVEEEPAGWPRSMWPGGVGPSVSQSCHTS